MISSVREERDILSAIVYLVIMWFLFGEVPSSSCCLGCASLFYCGTPGPPIIFCDFTTKQERSRRYVAKTAVKVTSV